MSQPLQKVQIPKPSGKMRVLGISVARDRVIQQAIRQVIEPGIDRTFSNHSHGFRPTMEAKRNLIRALKRLMKRNRPGTFKDIITEINQATRGWINYFGRGFIRGFIEITQYWLNRRLRQLILKRWKRVRTRYKMLRQYGLDHRSAMKIAQSRKKYWRLSNTHEVHRALTTKKLYKWVLIPLVQLAELAYARY